MVINSIDINKTKESLNRDGDQFHRLYETRGNATTCGMIYYYKYLAKIKITSW
jgi:hypothetical protein